MTYGPIYGIPVGARFSSRTDLYAARVHRDIQRRICGGTDHKQGAESVVITGEYEDDLDLGQIVYFTGIGHRDKKNRPIADQEFTNLNQSLAVNIETGQPVRLTRYVQGQYEFSGLFAVEDAFLRAGAAGFLICQYRLRALLTEGHSTQSRFKPDEVRKVLVTHYRLVRDAGVPSRVKALYDHHCQICDVRIKLVTGAYSEGAHIVPLGGGSAGPDTESNVLCLCPNHHVMLDHGALYFTDDWAVVDSDGSTIAQLTRHPDHHLDPTFAKRHRELMGFPL